MNDYFVVSVSKKGTDLEVNEKFIFGDTKNIIEVKGNIIVLKEFKNLIEKTIPENTYNKNVSFIALFFIVAFYITLWKLLDYKKFYEKELSKEKNYEQEKKDIQANCLNLLEEGFMGYKIQNDQLSQRLALSNSALAYVFYELYSNWISNIQDNNEY